MPVTKAGAEETKILPSTEEWEVRIYRFKKKTDKRQLLAVCINIKCRKTYRFNKRVWVSCFDRITNGVK